MSKFFERPLVWIGFFVLSAICFIYSFYYFDKSFPIVNITITTNRSQVIDQSDVLAEQFDWQPKDPFTAASFETDSKAQTFIELDGGGQQAFLNMLKHEWYMPYTWKVRRFLESDVHEAEVYFTPDGTPYGFKETIAEDDARETLSKKESLALAKETAPMWNVDLAPYHLVEYAKDQKPQRTDRVFVFERNDITLGQGRYRIKIRVSGDKVTQIKQFINIPQSFDLQYTEMRSANVALSSAAAMFAYFFYLLIGAIFGLFILIRSNWVIWRTPTICAFIVATLQAASTINSLPTMWMYYNTEIPIVGYLLNIIVSVCSSFFMSLVIVGLLFTAAESLGRRAFGNHVQLWKSWSPGVANSYTILGQTVAGYLLVGIDIALTVSLYFITKNYFGWWLPMSQFTDPNVLAHYFPWLSSIATSLYAGATEEAQFRAIPLAGAALLGKKFGKQKWWIAVALLTQAIVFGAAHANYPAMPSHARLVELIIPSIIYGLIYLRFGLLPVIVCHYAYDVFWLALPIFVSTAPRIWIHQLTVLLFAFIPILVILFRRYTIGGWQKRLAPEDYNYTWSPQEQAKKDAVQTPTKTINISRFKKVVAVVCTIISGAIWVYTTQFDSDAPPLRLYRNEAIQIAQETLDSAGIDASAFQPYARIQLLKDDQHKYIWQTHHDLYQTLQDSYLTPPHWLVRFLKFQGTPSERAESYNLVVGPTSFSNTPDYKTLQWKHFIAEDIPGAQLTKKEARIIVQDQLQKEEISLDDVYEISATPKRLPQRTDWTFVYGNNETENLKKGILRTVTELSGDKVSYFYKEIHVPELWQRDEQKQQTTKQAVMGLCFLFIRVLFILSMLVALTRWAHGDMSSKTFIASLLLFGLILVTKLINNVPNILAYFNTQAPFQHQLFSNFGIMSLQFILQTVIFALGLALLLHVRQRYAYKTHNKRILRHPFRSGIDISDLLGLCGGMMLAATISAVSYFGPHSEPVWSNSYLLLSTSSPFIAWITSNLFSFLTYTIGFGIVLVCLNSITDYGKHRLVAAYVFCFIAMLCLNGMLAFETISYWVISGSVYALIAMVIWYFFLRYSLASIPMMALTIIVMEGLKEQFMDVIPHISPLWGIILMTIITLLLKISITKNQKALPNV